MAWTDFKFTPEDGLDNTTTFPSKPTSGAAARAQFMTILNQIKAFLNGGVKDYVDEHKAENVHIGNNEAVKVYHNANQSFVSGADLYVNFNSEYFDNANMHDNAIDNSKLTCVTAGKYLINALIRFVSNPTGNRVLRIVKNKTNVLSGMVLQGVSNDTTELNVTTIAELTVGDYVEVRISQTSGETLDSLYLANMSPIFSMVRVG